MDKLVADYNRMNQLADDLSSLVSSLELGDSHYLRNAMSTEVTGSSDVTDACDDFEKEWSFGRDRISSTLGRLVGFLRSAAMAYEEADVQLAIALAGGGSCQIPSQSQAAWWQGLSNEQQKVLIHDRPSAIGNLDGLPPDVRYRANANAIREHIEYLKITGADPHTIARFESYLKPDPLLDSKIAELHKAGADPETIARFEQLRDAQRKGDPPRQILLFDPSGEGRIAEVHGSLKTADNIVVFVPGIGNDLANFSETTNSQGQNLYAAGRADTAVVSWLGYDTPSGMEWDSLSDPSAITADRAQSEAAQLISLTEGLEATVGGTVTVAAHSYGTVLTTIAAQHGMSVDKIILIGDPGVPASHVSEYNGSEVFAMRHPLDPISNLNHHGHDPTLTEFGATVLQPNDSSYRDEILKSAATPLLGPIGSAIGSGNVAIGLDGHVSFFENQSTSIANIMGAAEGDGKTIDGFTQSSIVHEDGSAQDLYLPKF
jgi:pimeloyl-ACP methyl ester carboxylesterase